MRRALAALALAAVVLAGCAADEAPEHAADGPAASVAEWPDTCHPGRAATAHRDGAAVPAPAVLVPCYARTGQVSREPTIGVAADGTVFHYPAMVADNTRPTGVAVSQDRGQHWSLAMPTLEGAPTHLSSLDPYLYLDPGTGRVFADDLLNPFCSYSSWSDDNGATWDHTVAGCLEADHQTVFAGPPTVSDLSDYPNVVYRCAINAVMLGGAGTMSTCQKSLDGGRVWGPFGEPAFTQDADKLPDVCGGAHGHGIADAKGTIYLPKGHCGVPMLAISDDEGSTWRRVAVSTLQTQDHDLGVGVDRDGTIYAAFAGPGGYPLLVHSSDAGATWSEPVDLAPPDVSATRFQELAVGAPGHVAAVYYGSRDAGDPAETSEAMMAVSYDALSEHPTILTLTFNDPAVDAFVVGPCCGGVQDFIDVRIGPDGTPWGAFIDDCIGPGRECSAYTEALDTQREGIAAWAEGPGLWDDVDPNGPYP